MGDAIGKEGGGLISEGVLSSISLSSVIRSPNLSTCHRCGLGFPINGSVDRLKTLDSQWRVVLLCRECFAGVRSAQICSYCLSCFPELEKGLLDCSMCSRRVHRACVPLHHRNFSHSLLDAVKFICVDCCPIPQLRREDPKRSGGSTSRTAFSVSLDDSVRGETSISEKKVTSKGKTRENGAKKVMVARGSSVLKRKAFGAVHFAKEPSYINLTVPDEKMALRLHQTINGSQRISRSLCPNSKGVSRFTVPTKERCSYNSVVRIVDSNSCAHHGMIEVSTENKSLLGDREKSESILANSTLFKRENGDLMRQVRGCNTDCPEDFSLNEMEGSLKFPDSTDDGSNAGFALLPCHSLNTWLKSTMSLTKYRFGDCDGEEGSSKLQRKSIDVIGPDRSMKKYSRKSWGSGRIMRGNSHSILSNNPLFKQENGDLMKQNMVCSTGCPRDFSLQEKESSLKFPDSTDDGSNASSTLLPCHSLNTWLNSTMPVTKYRFGDCDGVGYSKLQRKSIDAMGPGISMKKYFRKRWESGRIMQGDSHSILINCPLFKRKNSDLMKQTRGCNTVCPGDFSLKEKESSLKFPDSIDDVSNSGPALLPYHSLNTLSNSSMALSKDRFGDGEGPSKLQRKSIDAIAYRSMKKYFRKHWSSKRIIKGNSELILINSPLIKKENEDLTKQIRGCNTGYSGGFSLKEKESTLKFPDSTNDDSNAGTALLPCHSLNTWSHSTIPLAKYRFGDGERYCKMQRRSIEEIVSDNMKKYYRKRQGSKRNMQENSQSILADGPLFNRENGDLMKQIRGCNTGCPGDFSLKEEEISLKFPDSTDDGSNIGSALLQCHSLNSTMPLIKYRFGDGDGEGYSKLQRRSIDAIGSEGSLKKYFRKHLGSGRIMQGNNTQIPL